MFINLTDKIVYILFGRYCRLDIYYIKYIQDDNVYKFIILNYIMKKGSFSGKESLLTKTDFLIYKTLLKGALCSTKISNKISLDKNVVNKRLRKIFTFEFLDEKKVDGLNQKNYSIKPKFQQKIKSLVELFEPIINQSASPY